MTEQRMFVGGQELQLGKRVGKGGEGEVFAIANMAGFAVKAYLPHIKQTREKKIQAMVAARLADTAPLIAFPHKEVTGARGEFLGFVMRLVENHKEIHEIQTPASRFKYFPKADYRFLVRVALNIARVFAQVHASGCVVGDINQRSILVSQKATVALIDADSFQVTYNGDHFPCVVGVPEYTPPELQGRSLVNSTRTTDHDAFGLAVCLFQLLCMDRHPFSGRYNGRGEMPLEKAISEFRFAYSARNTGMIPPPGSITLADFTPKIAQLFEQAFSDQHLGRRPKPIDWVGSLSELESGLRPCSRSRLHHYARNAPECPWCRMEGVFGRPVFIDIDVADIPLPQGRIDPNSGYRIDIAALLSVINAIPLPAAISVTLPTVPTPRPSPDAIDREAKKRQIPFFKWVGAAGLGAALVIFYGQLLPPFAAIVFACLGFALLARAQSASTPDLSKYYDLANKIKKHAEHLQKTAPLEPVIWKKAEIVSAVEDYKALVKSFQGITAEYDKARRQKQLDDFLSGYTIKRAGIPKLKSTDVAGLASFGITTAFDASRRDVTEVYGIGPVKASNIAMWVKGVEAKFRFNNLYTPEDQRNIRQAQSDIVSQQQGLDDRLKKLVEEYRGLVRAFEAWRTSKDPQLIDLCTQLSQEAVDLAHLGVTVSTSIVISPIPAPNIAAKQGTATSSPPFPARTSPPSPGSAPICPVCSSKMVRRTARRGARRGRQFWGCSRYPVCQGTRN